MQLSYQATIPVTFTMIAEARARRASIDKAASGKGHFNLGDRWLGELGQACFGQFLDRYGFPYKTDKPLGRPDKYDFLIYGKKIEVKTTIVGKSFLIPHQQIGRPADVYLFIKVDRKHTVAYICGWINKDEVLKTCTINNYLPNPAYTVPARSLHSMKIPSEGTRVGGDKHV